MGVNPHLAQALADAHGAIWTPDHPHLAGAIRWARTRGELVSPFRNVHLTPDADHLTWVRALMLADPDAVATGVSAAYLHGWTPTPPESVTAASSLKARPGYVLRRREIPKHLQVRRDGVRHTTRALTALDLAAEFGVTHIDEALRHRVGLDQLWEAYWSTPNRPGWHQLQRWLTQSRTEPWSAAERAAHAALDAASLRGWVANCAVPLDAFDTAWPDIAFRSLRLAIEIDGRGFHDNSWSFERDRFRDARLAALGWQVVRFPASYVLNRPREFVAEVRRIVDARARIVA